MTANALLLMALAAAATHEGQGEQQGGVAVSNSAPPIVEIPYLPSAPVRVVPAPVIVVTPPRTGIVAAPRPKTPLQNLVSQADYPMSALASREAGRVEFLLDVGENGRVLACTVTRSSGSSALDATTCRIVRSRARFTPARDNNGMPAGHWVKDSIEWRLPAGDGERG